MDLLDLKLHAFSDYFLPESQTYFSLKNQKTSADECSWENTQIHCSLAIFFTSQGLSSRTGHYIPLQVQELCSTIDLRKYIGENSFF